MKVAIVCDWLIGTGGAERVVLELHKMYPEAPIYTSQYNPDPRAWYGGEWFRSADIRTGWLQKLPLGLRKFLPVLRAFYFSRLDLSAYDLVISSSGAEAKFIKIKKPAIHICYCHAPTHYYWARYKAYLKGPGFGRLDPLARLGLRLLSGPMRLWDKKAAGRPDYLLANSNYTRDQIKKYYGRQATVIHPPVDVSRFKHDKTDKKRSGFVTAGRQTPYKMIGLAVDACSKLSLPLTVIGNGPEHDSLIKKAGPSVTFVTDVSDNQLADYFSQSAAFIFPGIDDFGIVAVEALAAGTPVIAYHEGGALDYVNQKSGALFKPQTPEALAKTLSSFDDRKFDRAQLRHRAKKFKPANFRQNVRGFIKANLKAGIL